MWHFLYQTVFFHKSSNSVGIVHQRFCQTKSSLQLAFPMKGKQKPNQVKKEQEEGRNRMIFMPLHSPWPLPVFWDLVKWEIPKSCIIPQSKSFSYTGSHHTCGIMRTCVSAVSHCIQFGIWSYLQLLRQIWLAVTWKILLELIFSTDELSDFVSPSINCLLCFHLWSVLLYSSVPSFVIHPKMIH